MVFLKLLGGAALERDGARITGPPSHRHRLALLALLASSPSRALTREKLMALLWPDREAGNARKLLNQSVYVVRRAAGAEAVLTRGDEVRLGTGAIDVDVIAFEQALERGDLEEAVGLYTGPFLDGFFLPGALEFERWAGAERARRERAYARALEGLAEVAEREGRRGAAVEWWRARAAQDPYDSRVALRLMRALAAFGNPAGAIQHATDHARILRSDLGIEPSPAVRELAERLRREAQPRGPAGGPAPRLPTPAHRPASGSSGAAPPAAAGGGARPAYRAAVRYATAAVVVLVGLVAAWFALGPTGAVPSDSTPVHAGTRSIAAHEYYLRGTDPTLLRDTDAARQGLEYFHRAIALDSTYASAWAGLTCLALRVSTDDGTDPSRTRLRTLAETAALRAVELDDSLAEAHAALGLVRMSEFDFRAAESRLRRATEMAPDRIRPRHWLMNVYLWTGRPAAALAEAKRAVDLDPLAPTATAELARALAANDRCDEALTLLEPLRALEPPLLRVAPIAVRCYTRTGRWDAAIALLRAEVERHGHPLSKAMLGYALGRGQRRAEAGRIRTELLDLWRRGGDALPVAIASAGLGDADRTFAWLARAIDDGSLTGLPVHFQVVDILGESLRHDPRFEELSARLHLAMI